MARETWDEFGIRLAYVASKQSYDPKLKVGAAIVSNSTHSIISLGFNGRAPGEPHERESNQQFRSGFLHAEENAILEAMGRWHYGDIHTLYSTSEPCDMCARRIIRVRPFIGRVVYSVPYVDDWRTQHKLDRGAEILIKAGIGVAMIAIPEI